MKRKTVTLSGAAASAPASALSGVIPPATGVRHWLMKSEAADYSIDDLCWDRQTAWDGVRNAVAQRNMRAMGKGDLGLFYHSNCGKKVGVVGEVQIVRTATPNPAQTSSRVDVELTTQYDRLVSLEQIKKHSVVGGALSGMVLFRNSRLSVQPVSEAEFEFIRSMAQGTA
jgi:predicted RNA-binding protein with PUA-like domain